MRNKIATAVDHYNRELESAVHNVKIDIPSSYNLKHVTRTSGYRKLSRP